MQSLCVFLGAGFGAVARWWLSVWLAALFPGFSPGTTAVNLAGSFLIGLLTGAFELRAGGVTPEMRLLLSSGFLGGFTTFSAFSLEAVTLFSSRAPLAVVLVIAKVALCLALTYAGLGLARRIW